MPEQGLGLIIYQNAHQVYWDLQAKGLEHDTVLVRISKYRHCIINTPPIVCQQSFLNWLEMDDITQSIDAVEENFKHYVGLLIKIFDLDIGDALSNIEIATVVDLSFLKDCNEEVTSAKTICCKLRSKFLAAKATISHGPTWFTSVTSP